MTFVVLTEIYESKDLASSSRACLLLREVAINTSHIIFIRENSKIKNHMDLHGLWPSGLDTRNEFVEISTSSSGMQASKTITVVGALSLILEKICEAKI